MRDCHHRRMETEDPTHYAMRHASDVPAVAEDGGALIASGSAFALRWELTGRGRQRSSR